jgi:hypothetical protein
MVSKEVVLQTVNIHQARNAIKHATTLSGAKLLTRIPTCYPIHTTAGFNTQNSVERTAALKPSPYSWQIHLGFSLP